MIQECDPTDLTNLPVKELISIGLWCKPSGPKTKRLPDLDCMVLNRNVHPFFSALFVQGHVYSHIEERLCFLYFLDACLHLNRNFT